MSKIENSSFSFHFSVHTYDDCKGLIFKDTALTNIEFSNLIRHIQAEEKARKIFEDTFISSNFQYNRKFFNIKMKNFIFKNFLEEVNKTDFEFIFEYCHDVLLYSSNGIEIHCLFDEMAGNTSEFPNSMVNTFIFIKTPSEEKLYLCEFNNYGYICGINKLYKNAGEAEYFELTYLKCNLGLEDKRASIIRIKNGSITEIYSYKKEYKDLESSRISNLKFLESNGKTYMAMGSYYGCAGMASEFRTPLHCLFKRRNRRLVLWRLFIEIIST